MYRLPGAKATKRPSGLDPHGLVDIRVTLALHQLDDARFELPHEARAAVDERRVDLHETRPGLNLPEGVFGGEDAADADDGHLPGGDPVEIPHEMRRSALQRAPAHASLTDPVELPLIGYQPLSIRGRIRGDEPIDAVTKRNIHNLLDAAIVHDSVGQGRRKFHEDRYR